eukprot:GHVQ01035192.1.p2 GENE.GHVQ01035192.1~~GHVQ01035192.1.p2  ORF type:complete len:123 (-),score=26.28 GHVQ01035192.1:538-906(-)
MEDSQQGQHLYVEADSFDRSHIYTTTPADDKISLHPHPQTLHQRYTHTKNTPSPPTHDTISTVQVDCKYDDEGWGRDYRMGGDVDVSEGGVDERKGCVSMDVKITQNSASNILSAIFVHAWY